MTAEATTKWVLDPMHSEVQFKVKHLVISTVTGFFKTFEGDMETKGDHFDGAEATFSLDVNSIDTNQSMRDDHIKGAEFFDAEQFPKISFKSVSFTHESGDKYKLSGDLTIKGITKCVILDVEHGGTAGDFYGNTKAGFEVSGVINRKEFGLTWSGVTDTGSVVLGDDIKILINAQYTKQA